MKIGNTKLHIFASMLAMLTGVAFFIGLFISIVNILGKMVEKILQGAIS